MRSWNGKLSIFEMLWILVLQLLASNLNVFFKSVRHHDLSAASHSLQREAGKHGSFRCDFSGRRER